MSHPHELLIPPKALANPQAREFLRAWAVDKGLQVSLKPYPDAGVSAWGIILADILRHVADAHQQSEGADREQTIREILSVFMAEFDSPTDTPHGDFIR
jgi:hypothetical protein